MKFLFHIFPCDTIDTFNLITGIVVAKFAHKTQPFKCNSVRLITYVRELIVEIQSTHFMSLYLSVSQMISFMRG